MHPWDLLGIEPTQDPRVIKRAYAKLLQVHRPDEDQAAFERLRRAYEQALASVPTQTKQPVIPTLDLTPPGPNAQMPELLSAQFAAYPPPASDPLPPPEPVQPPDPSPLQPPDTEPDPDLLKLDYPPPELGWPLPPPPRFEEPRREQRRRTTDRQKTPPPAPEIPLPPPPRPPPAIAAEIVDFCAGHGDDPSALQHYLAEQPDLFNVETKSAVSVEVARLLVAGSLLPLKLQPLIVHFFEWDTFTEQRRLSGILKKPEQLRLIVTAAEMQHYLDGAPVTGKDREATRRQLRRIRAAGSGWRAWLYAELHPFADKRIGTALADADRRFGGGTVTFVLGMSTVRFWKNLVAAEPNLIQGGVRFLRSLALYVAAFLAFAPLWIADKDNPIAPMVATLGLIASLASMFYFGRWLVRAFFYALKKYVGPGLKRFLVRVDLLNRRRLFGGILAIATVAGFIWPAGWSGWYLAAGLSVLLFLTFADPNTVLAVPFTVIATFICFATREPAHPHWYVTGWLLACLYVQWLGFWGHRLLRRWRQQTKLTAAGVAFVISAVLMVAAILFLNLTKPK